MATDIWTPDRTVKVDSHSRTTTQIHPGEMQIIAAMHGVAQRREIVLACARCRRPFQGLNSERAHEHVVFCDCRELRATVQPTRIQV